MGWWIFWFVFMVLILGTAADRHHTDRTGFVDRDTSDYEHCLRQRPWYRARTCDGEQTLRPSQLGDRR